MESSDEAATAAEDAKRKAKQRDMERKRRRDAKVKIMQDEIYGTLRPEDNIQTLERGEDKEHIPVRLLKLKKDAKPIVTNPTLTDADAQVNVKELKDPNTYDKKKGKKETEEEPEPEKTKMRKGDEKIASQYLVENNIIPPRFGFFGDNKRRIDLIIVMEDDHRPKVQEIKIDFLTNVLKTGLEFEFAPGMMREHRHLIFIKVHATDKVLEDYADLFGMKKYFKDKHLEFVKPEKSPLDWLLAVPHEREWIKMVRRQYVQPLLYSNLERSYIVYMMLRHLRFGEPNNYYSITRLMKNRIILDAYALHDGPYFYIHKQDFENLNTRQILFYNWTSFENIFSSQPINLIYEYFGPKIGFYFAFYEFYNKALIIPIVLGMVVFFFQVSMFDDFRPTNDLTGDNKTRYPMKKLFFRPRESDVACGLYGKDISNVEFDKIILCPKCRNFNVCPFIKLKDYCESVHYKSFLDNHTALYFSFIICILVFLFITFWKRTENYWVWMWELGHLPKRNTIRTEYAVHYKYPTRSLHTGIWLNRDGPTVNNIRILISNIIMLFSVLLAIALTGGLIWLNYNLLKKYGEKMDEKKVRTEYLILSAVAIAGCVGAFICEPICVYISYKATKFENHRLHEDFESSYILKIFSCSFALTLPMLILIALVKGTFYFTPLDNYSPQLNITLLNKTVDLKADWLGDLFITNCGYYGGCWDEVVLYYTLIVIFKVLVTRIPRYFRRLTTDYNQGRQTNKSVPSYEREYTLDTMPEHEILLRMNDIMIQITLFALFGFTNCWTMLLAFLMNIMDMRIDARDLLLGCRRPLLYRYVGLGMWIYILYFICYISVITMALMFVNSSSLIDLYVIDSLTETMFYQMIPRKKMEWIAHYRFTKFETKHYNLIETAKKSLSEYKKKKPEFCFFPGVFVKAEKPKIMPWPFTLLNVSYPGELRYVSHQYKKKTARAGLFLTYFYTAAAIFLVIRYYYPAIDEKTKEIMHMERNLLRVHLQDMKEDKKPVDPAAKPVAPAAKPVDPAAKPVEPAAKPVDPAAKPVDPAAKPVAPAAKPVDPAVKPVDPAAKPVEPAAKPVDPAAKPVDPAAKPVDPAAKPVDPAAKPVDPAAKPVDPAAKPVDPAAKPVDPAAKPVDPVAKPVDPAAKSVEPAAKPVDPAAKPVDPAVKPVDPAAKPVDPAAKPVNPAAKPVDPVAKPVEPAAKPVDPAAKPVDPAVKPVNPAAKPKTTKKRKPVSHKQN